MTTDPYADVEIPLPRLRTITHLWGCAALLIACGVAATAVDVPLANWVRDGNCPGFLQKLGGLSEVFGHGIGVLLIVVTIGVLDPWHRYAIPRILAASLGSGLVANAFKLLLARERPHHALLNGHGMDTFLDWFPLASNASWQQSFPSSHTATAAGLAIVLAAFYPRGRWLFPLFAAGAAMQRVLGQSHFLSDALWGAAVGCIFAPLCVYGSRINTAFDRLENFLLARTEQLAKRRRPRTIAPAKIKPAA